MLPAKPLAGAKHRQSITQLSLRFLSAAPNSVRPFRIACAVILICAAAGPQLSAQAQPSAAQLQERKECEDKVVSPAEPPAKSPDNIADGTKAALACEWIDPRGVGQVLKAFELLTSSLPAPDLSQRVLHELEMGDPYPGDWGFYVAAMGDPGPDGPRVQGLPNFLDTLAKANTLKKKKPDNEDELFASTKQIVDEIFGTGPGKLDLVRIHDSFSRKNNYLALYQLLDAGWQGHDANDLEKLRAAFEMNSDLLAKQVAAKVSAAKD
jgi:hypothetical protein